MLLMLVHLVDADTVVALVLLTLLLLMLFLHTVVVRPNFVMARGVYGSCQINTYCLVGVLLLINKVKVDYYLVLYLVLIF